MRLRKAEKNEFEAVRRFYWELIDLLADRTDTAGWKKGIYPSDAFLRESVEKGEMYVLDGDGGFSVCAVLNSEPNEGYAGIRWGVDCGKEEVLIPHALGVHPALHRRGVGSGAVEDILEIARTRGMKAVRLDVLKGNRAAERLYEKAGFRYIETKLMYYEDTGLAEYEMYEFAL